MAPGEEDGPHGAASAPAKSPGLALDRLLLVLAVLSAALVFWPPAAGTALLHWNIIGAGHEFIALLRKLGLWSCLACMAASWLLEKEKEEGGHQAIIFRPARRASPGRRLGHRDASALRGLVASLAAHPPR